MASIDTAAATYARRQREEGMAPVRSGPCALRSTLASGESTTPLRRLPRQSSLMVALDSGWVAETAKRWLAVDLLAGRSSAKCARIALSTARSTAVSNEPSSFCET